MPEAMDKYTVKLQIREFDRLETLVERAISEADRLGAVVEFGFDGTRYICEPGSGYVNAVGQIWRDEERSRSSARNASEIVGEVIMCSREVVENWTFESLLAAGSSVSDYRDIAICGTTRFLVTMSDRFLESARIEIFRNQEIRLYGGAVMRFISTDGDLNSVRGMAFDVAFLEDKMSGNYNPFPWVDKTLPLEKKWELEKSMGGIGTQGLSALGPQVNALEKAQALTPEASAKQRELYLPGKPYDFKFSEWSRGYSGWNTPYMGIDRSAYVKPRQYIYMSDIGTYPSVPTVTSMSATERLSRLRQKLKPLMDFLQNSIMTQYLYEFMTATGLGPQDAAECLALLGKDIELIPDNWGVPDRFTAESSDGAKVVIAAQSTGVIFDPKNRPVRRFKLHEIQ